MKKVSVETGDADVAGKQAAPPPPPPPPPPLLEKRLVSVSVTNREIAKFWREKRLNEEDHLLAAIKAAARIRARKLTQDEDYKHFEESLHNDDDSEAENPARTVTMIDEKELHIGIKDWWTKSMYAYLNQPALGSVDKPKRRTSSYIPNFCNYMPPSPPTASFGIF